MKDAGYTLTEMLAALAILGLAMAGLTQAAQVIGRMQTTATHAASDAVADRKISAELQSLLASEGPFWSDGRGGFSGTAMNFEFTCAASRCGASLTDDQGQTWLLIRRGTDVRRLALRARSAAFSYADDTGTAATWPAGQLRPQKLQDVVLKTAGPNGESPIASAHLWIDEPANCVFDPIAQGCRS